jgi:hypothetical protein
MYDKMSERGAGRGREGERERGRLEDKKFRD